MSTMRPRPPASQSLRSQNVARDKDVEQVRRLLTSQAKPVAAAAGGGISGVTRCDAVTYTVGSGGTLLTGDGWVFSSLYGSTGPTVSTGADPSRVYVAEAGWYMATFHYNVSFSAVPENLNANIMFTGSDVDYPTDFQPIYTEMGSVFAQSRQSFSSPWVLLPAGGYFRGSLTWDAGPTVGSFHHFTLDITKSG